MAKIRYSILYCLQLKFHGFSNPPDHHFDSFVHELFLVGLCARVKKLRFVTGCFDKALTIPIRRH